jgi:hypothetical protein
VLLVSLLIATITISFAPCDRLGAGAVPARAGSWCCGEGCEGVEQLATKPIVGEDVMRKLMEFADRAVKGMAEGVDMLVSLLRQYAQILRQGGQIAAEQITQIASIYATSIQEVLEDLSEAQLQVIDNALEPLAVYWEREHLRRSIAELQVEIERLSEDRNQARSQVEELKQELADLERIASASEEVRHAMVRQVQRTVMPELKSEVPAQLRKELESLERKQRKREAVFFVAGIILTVILELIVSRALSL